MEQVKKFLNKVIYILKKPYMRVLPGQLAFFTVLSLVPLIAILGTIASYFNVSLASFNDILEYIPADLSSMISTGFGNKGLTFNFIVFLLTAFFLASNGSHSIIITSNEIFGIKGRGFFGRRIKAILITFILVWIILFTLIVPVFGNSIFHFLRIQFGNLKVIEVCARIFDIIKIPVTMIFMFYAVKIIYNIAPDEKKVVVKNNIGPAFTTIMWIIGTEIYSVYTKFFSNYNLFYGSISNIIILMIWLYYLSYVFVLGMAINATGEKELDLTTKIGLDDINNTDIK